MDSNETSTIEDDKVEAQNEDHEESQNENQEESQNEDNEESKNTAVVADQDEPKPDYGVENDEKADLAEGPSEENDDVTVDSPEAIPENISDDALEEKPTPRRGSRKRNKIYSEDDDPDTIKEKRKRRSVELKLRNLKCSFNETPQVSGKRLKKPPQRFELQPSEKRKCTVDEGKGHGELLGNIRWINHQLRAASLYNLRLLHRVIYRKQGMFAEKHLIKNLMKFNGFPFDSHHPEVKRRKEQLERLTNNALQQLSYMLGLRPGTNEEMMDRIIRFLMCPSQKAIEAYITEVMDSKLQQQTLSKHTASKPYESHSSQKETSVVVVHNYQDDGEGPCFPQFSCPVSKVDLNAPWVKPVFFMEGNGVKLKYIRAVITNIEAASDAFIELMHRLLFLDVDEKTKMRRNILEFSGLKCEVGTPNYVYRVRILSVLPMEQLKLICRVLCLPTWHRSRQFLTDGIMDFLSVPRISAMKKRVPPVFSEEISFSFEGAHKSHHGNIPELKSLETEEIEIIPDIHIPDENTFMPGSDFHMENEYLGVKLKNFSNIHYQVISTPVTKLNDVHMILYLTPSAQNNIRRNILEFSGFSFDESSADYQNRRTLMEQMSVEDLKTVATVLCVSQYICDDSKKSLVDAILKFLLKPSALLSSSTIMPTISQTPVARINSPPIVKKKATSTTLCSKTAQPVTVKPEIVISNVGKPEHDSKNSSVKFIIDAISSSGNNEIKTEIEIEKVKACLSNSSIEITPVPPTTSEKEPLSPTKVIEVPKKKPDVKNESKTTHNTEADILLSDVKKEVATVAPRIQYFGSDDEDDQPLSKMIGHPNDDQLKALVSKIIKESKLEDITMKHVIRKVFGTYPNYDLNYRKEFIKSNVRLILSQMDDQNCSVSTTVVTI